MRKWLLITTAVVGVWIVPTEAHAGVVIGAVTTLAGWFAGLAPLAQAAIQLGAGLLLSAATARTPSQQDLKRELTLSTERPAKRWIYGHFATTGTPAPWRVKNNRLLGCIIFNSRPSAGTNLTFTIDGRECVFAARGTGTELTDPNDWEYLFDFSSDGELVKIKEKFPDWDANETQALFWLGLGDQTAPPAYFTDNYPEYFSATDAWRGCTVLWVSLSAGGSVSKRPKRWPNPKPQIELAMDWSMVWDPEDEAQDPDDPDTWTFSDNQARCLLDAVRFNPVRAYGPDQMVLSSFTDAVPLAEEPVTRWHDSVDAGETVTEPRYRVAGVVDWTKGELHDLLQPLAAAGAGQLAVVGGQLSYIPGAYQQPVYTMSDILDDSAVDFRRLGPRREVPYALKGTWTSAERYYETAELEPRLISGGSTSADDIEEVALPLVPSGTQCQRIVKIEAGRRAAQKRLSCTLPPSAIALVPGASLTGALPSPFTRLNGGWQVEKANPSVWVQDGEGRARSVVLRVPVTLREYSASIFDWDPETDEQEILSQDLSGENVELGTVEGLFATTIELDSGGAVVLMVEFSFDAITDYVVDEYEVGWREDGETVFVPLPDIPDSAIETSTVVGQFGPVAFGKSYDLRVRAVGPTSEGLWSYALGIVAGLELSSVSGSVGAMPGTVEVDATTPDSGYFDGVRLMRAATGDPYSSAVQVGQDVPLAANAAHSVVFGNVDYQELLENGDFGSATGWTEGGNWSISGGQASHTVEGSPADLEQAVSLIAGESYRVITDVASAGSGSTFPKLVGSSDVSGADYGSAGLVGHVLVAPASPTAFSIEASSLSTAVLNSVSLHRMTSADIPAGEADFWVVPYTKTGTNGTPTLLGTFTIT
ncbi:phage tail protein [Salipiger thiooxidans]|uniref:phage tail protein n=1 Tax=Salipiger thiooxidans TaxID=282683 RepID=UPI001CD6668A|nr:phage tail protein [Salipiger thiooxidans]MCA0848345.1 phage tail protein [Salipiger thiooxidans]